MVEIHYTLYILRVSSLVKFKVLPLMEITSNPSIIYIVDT